MRAEHLFSRHRIGDGSGGPADFDDREIEICRWSRKAPSLVPPGREAVILRVGYPYAEFAPWRLGERKRREGYAEFKKGLAAKLVAAAEHALPRTLRRGRGHGSGDAPDLPRLGRPVRGLDRRLELGRPDVRHLPG